MMPINATAAGTVGAGVVQIAAARNPAAAKGAEGGSGEEFSGAIAAADAVAGQMARAVQSQQLPSEPVGQSVPNPAKEEGSQRIEATATGKLDKALPRQAGGSAEASSLIQKMAVSTNTGVDIAGLKPWSPDWVFEGGLNRHPAQKTLVEEPMRGGSAGLLEGLQKLLRPEGTPTAGISGEQQSAGQVMAALNQSQAQALGHDLSDEFEGAKPSIEGYEGGREGVITTSSGSLVDRRQPVAVSQAMGGDEFLSTRKAAFAGGASLPTAPSSASRAGVQTPAKGPGQGPETGAGSGLRSRPIGGDGLRAGDELPGRKSKLPDTLGLIHPQMSAPQGSSNVLPFQAGTGTVRMEGGVVAGSMSRNRLSTESVSGIAQSIRQLGSGGEMRIRLKPDHLGELHLKVTTGGQAGTNVGLQIQASDDRARKILEESMGSLKESLASQNLNLGRVDVQVAPAAMQTASAGEQAPDSSAFAEGSAFSFSGQQQGGRGASGGEGSDFGSSGASDRMTPASSRTARPTWSTGGGSARPMASSRLDVIA